MSIHPSALSIAGLIFNLVGVAILFRFGIPYYVRTGGTTFLVTDHIDDKEAKAEHIASRLGWIGLALVVVGTLLQIASSYIAWTPG